MNGDYTDITSRIPNPPAWWDRDGAPRWAPMHPRWCPNIYADRVAFLRIACQACGHEFTVQVHTCQMERVQRAMALGYGKPKDDEAFAEAAALGDVSVWDDVDRVGYGDPPDVGCCAAGATMTSDTLEVLAIWDKSREAGYHWRLVGGSAYRDALARGEDPDETGRPETLERPSPECPDCTLVGAYEDEHGEWQHAAVSLCAHHAAVGAAREQGFIAGYDAAKGEGAHRRDFPDHYDGMIAT